MNPEFVKNFGQFAGIGGLALFVLLVIFTAIVKSGIFPTLTNKRAFIVIVLIIISVVTVVMVSIYAYLKVVGVSSVDGYTQEPQHDEEKGEAKHEDEYKQDSPEVQVTLAGNDGTPTFRTKLKENLTVIIQDINRAATGKLDLIQFNRHCSEYFTVDGANSLKLLIDRNRPLATARFFRLNLINVDSNSFEVRYVPVSLGTERANEKRVESLVFKITVDGKTGDGKVDRVDFALNESESAFFRTIANRSDTGRVRDFLERLKSAYNHKDIKSIERAFSDSALIIVGFVLSGLQNQQNYLRENSRLSRDMIKLIKLKKPEYIERLRRIFRINPKIYVQFDSLDVTEMGKQKTFVVQLIQTWGSTYYKDKGHLFFLLDFRKPKGFVWVRAWFPLEQYLNSPLRPGDFDVPDY